MVKKTKKDEYKESTDIREKLPTDDAEIGRKDDELLKRLEEAEKKAAENYDKYLRAVAELDNYRKRATKEKADAITYGNETLLKDILPILDSLDRATEQTCNSGEVGAFKEGLKLVKDQLLCCMAKHGVEKIAAVGEAFDPNLHDAMMQVACGEQGNNKVIEEFEKGYLLKGRLLKPARVSVGKAQKKEDN
jgi:molecular chaperone GrpE